MFILGTGMFPRCLYSLDPVLCPMEEFLLICAAGSGEMSSGKESRRIMMTLLCGLQDNLSL